MTMFPLRQQLGPLSVVTTVAPSGPTTLIHDTFTDAAGTLLNSHTIAPINVPSTSWTNNTGVWRVLTDNVAYMENSAANGNTTCNPLVSDCTISVVLSVIGPNTSSNLRTYQGIAARRAVGPPVTLWIIGANPFTNLLVIASLSGTTGTLRASVECMPYAGMTITAILSGSTITAISSGGETCSYANATINQASTIHGMFNYHPFSRFDNFMISG